MKKTIAIDFDGSCVTHDFPYVGKDIGAAKVLRELTDAGHGLILFTMRCDNHCIGEEYAEENGVAAVSGLDCLTDAVNWFKDNDIPLLGIQSHPDQKSWTSSPKAYAHIYIDDAALGCPLKYDPELSARPFVNWAAVRDWLEMEGLL